MITLIHGPAELLRTEALAGIRASISSEPELADLNTTRLDGRQMTLPELRNACDTLPFLGERRLIIIDGLLSRLGQPARGHQRTREAPEEGIPGVDEPPLEAQPGEAKAFLAYLELVPESTELVLLEGDTVGGAGLRRLQELARAGKARIIVAENPRRSDLPDWLRARARMHRLRLDPAAVAELAEFVGDNLRQLDQELIKLSDYASGRTITREDVRKLVPATRAANVFEMVDALGSGEAPKAFRLMKQALDSDGEPPLRLIAMIARQYRLLIQAKALQAQGLRPPEIARALNIADWTAPKLLQQASRHSFARLERAMERILAADEAIKTGKLGDREAMDILFVELAQPT